MKTVNYLAIFASAALLVFSSCEKTPQDETGAGLGSEASISSFTLVADGVSLTGRVGRDEIGISYAPSQFEALKNATADVVYSEGATVTPDPAVARDYTVEGGVVFTVTSEDGNNTAEYTVVLSEGKLSLVTKKVWEKKVVELGITTVQAKPMNGVGFSGSNIVTFDGQVYDIEGEKVGDLNLDGVDGSSTPGFQFTTVTNDNYGVLVASVSLDGAGNYTPNQDPDAQEGVTGAQTRVYAWLDGYDKAPTLIFTHATKNYSAFMAVSGDLLGGGGAILSHCSARSATQAHNSWTIADARNITDPTLATPPTYRSIVVPFTGTDPKWGNTIFFFDGNRDGAFIVMDCDAISVVDNSLRGNAVYYAESTANSTDPSSYVTLKGTLEGDYSGRCGYGNYSFGSAKPFTVDGNRYVAVASTGWSAAYLTIQPVDPNEDYLLGTTTFTGDVAQASVEVYTDPATGNIYVVYLVDNNEMVLYMIEKTYI